MRRALIAMVVILAGLVYSGTNASASCVTDGQGPCYRFWKVDAVFVAKLTAKEQPRDGDAFWQNYRLQVIVVEAFRGVALGARLTLFAPDGVCGGVHAEDGGELFVYASYNKNGELWAQGCGVSKPLEDAEADLAYARSVNDGGPAALVYGDVHQVEDLFGDSRDFSAMGGVLIRVVGRNFAAEAITDEDGNYAVTLPGSGAYRIEALPPDGFVYRIGGPETFEIADRRSCHQVTVQLKLNGRIRGRVVDTEDQPVANLVLQTGDSEHFGKTTASGEFEIGPLSEGTFSIEVLTGGERPLKFQDSRLVGIAAGQVTSLQAPLRVTTHDLVALVIEVKGSDAGEVFVQVTAESTGAVLGNPIAAGPDPIRLLVQKNQSFEILAVSTTHHARTVLRPRAPETAVILTPRRREPQ